MIAQQHAAHLENLWLQQLHLEFAAICRAYGIKLQPPIFQITESAVTYGSWQQETSVLSLSRHLIQQFPWSIVTQVLKHEMAHQLCHELLHGDNTSTSPHGSIFQQCCEQLGVLPEFRKARAVLAGTVASVTEQHLSEESRRHLQKIEKLLALAASGNEHEATLAMEKANSMLEKHHLQGLRLGEKTPMRSVIIDNKKKKIPRYQKLLGAILRQFFFVQVVLAERYDVQRNDNFKTMEIFGTKENVAIAEYCYHFLVNRLQYLWRVNQLKFKGPARTEKNSYFLGVLQGVQEQLKKKKESGGKKDDNRAQMRDLVVAEERRLEAYVGLYFPRLRRVTQRAGRVYGATYRMGVAEGRDLVLDDAVTWRERDYAAMLPCTED